MVCVQQRALRQHVLVHEARAQRVAEVEAREEHGARRDEHVGATENTPPTLQEGARDAEEHHGAKNGEGTQDTDPTHDGHGLAKDRVDDLQRDAAEEDPPYDQARQPLVPEVCLLQVNGDGHLDGRDAESAKARHRQAAADERMAATKAAAVAGLLLAAAGLQEVLGVTEAGVQEEDRRERHQHRHDLHVAHELETRPVAAEVEGLHHRG
mmetsp:Transcript_157694/g.483259  ORF Transcript_157694/g.483259 Transcript_157694/m.483259 type:complete len:210 (-) Transcript_157694:93-722(-)